MNNCKICGQPCGIYEICRECQKEVNEGKIQICNRCGNYYFAGLKCPCYLNSEEDQKNEYKQEETKENINFDNSYQNREEKEKTPFKDGVSKGFGTGCGCFLFIAAGIAILAIIIVSIINS